VNSYITQICLNASTNQFVHTVYSDIPVMSDLKDYSDKDGFEFLCNNEKEINSCDVDVDISADEHRPNNLLSQSDPPLFKSLSKNLLDMAEKLKFWSSKFFVRDGDEMIDILSAAQETPSTVPCGATQHTFSYPGTAYRFDPVIFHGEYTEFDINEVEKQLLSLMKLPTTIDGCHMILNRRKKNSTCHRKLTFDFICSHGRKMPSVKKSDFDTGRVGKLHAVTQTVKRMKNNGSVVKG
jgi:hypothetical protein